MPLIELQNIVKTFGGVKSLIDVSMTFSSGEAIALAGENGSGKSTLIKILSGAHKATSGQIIIDGKACNYLHPIEAVRAGIQVIYQDFALFPNLTVAENISFSQNIANGKHIRNIQESRKKASVVLKKLNVAIDLDTLVEDLSVANKQLVAIARALINDARLIVMDEPTTALTETEVQNLLGIIRKLKQAQVCVVFVSHKLQEVFSVCDRVVVLRNGQLVADGPISAFDQKTLTRHMTGRDLPETGQIQSNFKRGKQVLTVEGLGHHNKFSDVSFQLHEGEVIGIAGLLGSGRTELAKALFGLTAYHQGEINVSGKNVNVISPQVAIKNAIAYVPEDRLTEGLFFGQTVQSNVEAGLFDRFITRLGKLKKFELKATVLEWLQQLNVKGQPQQQIHALSGGNQQRVVLARWLAQKPKILILNGPTVGVDVGSKSEIHQIIVNAASSGMGTLLISDDLNELVACCHRVLVMKAGRITTTLEGKTLNEPTLTQAIAG